jgi:hypothetical protein
MAILKTPQWEVIRNRSATVGDMLVFHSEGGEILFGEKFWEGIA